MIKEEEFFSTDEKVISNTINSYTSLIKQKYGNIIKRVILYG